MKAYKQMKITKDDQINMMKKIERELQIELGMNYNRHRVHKNKKAYNRQDNKNICQ